MDIKRAKEEVKNTIEAYLVKDEYGEYAIPTVRQRPVLLMGPPGIGKTQIMEQIAKECKINLVSYTITHHTRQSAVGLPFIKEKEYGGKKYSVTEYTMSEIIASVYDKIEQTGIEEGILFIDEINCVSETLAPTMLQFLQGKTFGNQAVPKGWIIVAAGNPPEYNKSVREFDVVTLDRIKKINVEENFPVWKEYAYKNGLHQAVISYLEIRKQNFYRVETTVDGKYFATARGWEDLSNLIQVYEKLGKKIDREVVNQYIQHPLTAKDFANYLELYYKYKKDYDINSILDGNLDPTLIAKTKASSFDERLNITGLLNGKLSEEFMEYSAEEEFMDKLYSYLIMYKENKDTVSLDMIMKKAEQDMDEKKKQELLSKREERAFVDVHKKLKEFAEGVDTFEKAKELFEEEVSKHESNGENLVKRLNNAFIFIEEAFGGGQEMVAFVTEINSNYYAIQFIKENGSDEYFRHNKGLLFEERHNDIVEDMEIFQEMLRTR